MRIDPSIYNAPEYDIAMPDTGTPRSGPVQVPQPVSQSTVLAGQQSQAVALAAQAEYERPKAGILASMKAAASEWSPMQAYRYATAPAFEPDGINTAELLAGINMPLAEEEKEFLFDGLSSHAEFNYRMEVVERQRVAQRTTGDSPIASFVAMMADPGYLALGVATGGIGTVARAAGAGRALQRAVVGVSEVVTIGGAGLLEQQVRPMSDTEIIVGALLGGAAGTMLYRGGKLVKSNPDFPGDVLYDIASKGRVRNPDRLGPTAPHDFQASTGFRSGSELVDHLRSRFAGTEYSELLEAVASSPALAKVRVSTDQAFAGKQPDASGFWDRKNNLLYIREGTDQNTALHELVHATVEKRLLSDPKFRPELLRMRDEVVQALESQGGKDAKFWAQVFKKPGEFVTYALTSPKFREWAKAQKLGATGARAELDAPVQASNSLWDRVVDLVGSALGLAPERLQGLRNFMRGVELPARASAKSLDDRLQELVRASSNTPPGNLYTRGTVKDLDANMDEVQVRSRLAAAADKENIGRSIAWNGFKTMASYGPVGQKIAELMLDNPLSMRGDSVASQHRAIRADFSHAQFQFEDLFTKELAARKASIWRRIFTPGDALSVQRTLEKELQSEQLRRQRNVLLGTDRPSVAKPSIQAMADALDKVYALALKEMKAHGVPGAEDIAELSGHFSRKWDISNITDAKNRMVQLGRTPDEADKALERMVQQGVLRANAWDEATSLVVAKAILNRADRKGFFEDGLINNQAGNSAQLRDLLEASGASERQIQKAIKDMTGRSDEAGKMGALKRRIDIDTEAGMNLPDGTSISIADLINSDIVRNTEAYLDQVAGRIAFARKGVPNESDLTALRSELSRSIPGVKERGEAVKLFDNYVNLFMGHPTGEDLPDAMRNMQAINRMVGLSSSGLWQSTEYSTAMGRFTALGVLRESMREASFAALRRPDRATSTQLADVLSRNSSADIRIRPFINRLEDNFDVPPGAIVQSALLQAQQLVPYLNAQKLIQTHQARVVANLVVDTFRRAGQGDQKAIKALESYGLEPHIMTRIQGELAEAGMDTAKWSDSTWADVRGPLQKMMDDSVLRNRAGEIPAFAQFSQVGKFIFTFRNFVLGAHNKVLAGTISRDGLAGISLLMLYQFPLVLLATQANSTIQGKEIKSTEELIAKAFGQMGTLGLFSEILGVVRGEKQQWGAPGFIAIDRVYKLAGAAMSGDAGATANAAIQAMPLLSVLPGARAIGETFKESTKD